MITEQVEGYAWKLIEDAVNPDLYFLGTEFGLYLSLDAGKQWARFEGGLPKVAVHDLAVHPDGDLIIATHGRGIYVLDDLTPLRALDAKTLEADVALLPSRPAEMAIEGQIQNFLGNDEFVGQNPAEAASIAYWLKKRHLFGDLRVEILDRDGKLITSIPGTKRVGINRVEWPMRLPPPKLPPSTQLVPAFSGPRAEEGAYKIRLVKAKDTFDAEVRLVADRRSKQSAEDRVFQQRSSLDLYRRLERLTYVSEAVTGAAKTLRERAETLAAKNAKDASGREFTTLAKKLDEFANSFVATAEGYVAGQEKLREKLGNLYGVVNQYEGRPTNSQLDELERLARDADEVDAEFATWEKAIASANQEATRRQLEPVLVPAFDEWRKKADGGRGGGGSLGDARAVSLLRAVLLEVGF